MFNGRFMKNICCILLMFMLCMPSCKHTLPPDIWEKETMIEFIVEAQLVEAKVLTSDLPKKQRDSLYTRCYEELFAYYNTNQVIWQKNIDYYRDKPEEMDDIYKEVVLRLTLLESTVQQQLPNGEILKSRDSLKLRRSLRLRDSIARNNE